MVYWWFGVATNTASGEQSNEPAIQSLARQQSGQTNYLALGQMFLDRKDWGQALSAFDAAVENDSIDTIAYEYRGCAYLLKGDLDKGITDLSRAIELSPTNASAHFNRAGAYRAKEELAKALSDYAVSLRLSPTNHLALKSRAAIFSRMGDSQKAMDDLNLALRLNPKDTDALRMRGFNLQRLGQFAAAVESYRECLRFVPNETNVLNEVAWIQAVCPDGAVRNGKEAIKSAAKACELTNWKSSQFIDSLAAAFAETGDFVSAIKYQKRAVEIGNANSDVLSDMKKRLLLYEQKQPYREEVE